MAKTSRDDFKPTVKRRLRERVNNVCSRPTCWVVTAGAHTNPSKDAINIGVAAHICAAAPGGPRYDPTMSPGQRSDLANGIWLCASCATLIDRDVDEFRAPILREWKRQAEERSGQRIGRPLPRDDDAQRQIAGMLSGVPISNQPNLIRNAHQATATAMEQTDGRFRIETAFVNGVTTYTFHAREPVQLGIKVAAESVDAWAKGFASFIRHGRAVDLPAEHIRFRGSPIFEQLRASDLAGAKLRINPEGRPVVAKVSLRDATSGASYLMDDVHGTLSLGTLAAHFEGGACNGLLKIELRLPVRTKKREGKFTISTDFTSWVGRDVNSLSYFEKIFRFYEHARESWLVDIKLEAEGNYIFGATVHMPTKASVFLFNHTTLAYCNRVRTLAKHLGRSLEFRLSPPFSKEQHAEVSEYADMAQGERVFGRDEVGDLKFNIIADAGAANVAALLGSPGPHKICLSEDKDPLVIYGQDFCLPRVCHAFDDVTAVVEVDPASVKEGDAVPVIWSKGPNFKLTQEFETPEQASARQREMQ